MTIAFLLLLEALLTVYLVTRLVRATVAPSPMLSGMIVTAGSLLVAMLAVTEPVEVVLRGPGSAWVWVPTWFKHLALLGGATGVLLMGLAHRPRPEGVLARRVWAAFLLVSLAVTVLTVAAGSAGQTSSVDYVQWSHTQPLLQTAMALAYVGGFIASVGFVMVGSPRRLESPTERGLAIVTVGAVSTGVWCVLRSEYLARVIREGSVPDGGDLLVTKVISLLGVLLLITGLLWSTAEGDVRAWRCWRDFRDLHDRALQLVPEARRPAERRLGFDAWVTDRAVEMLDALHQVERVAPSRSGLPSAPTAVSGDELYAVAGDLGRRYTKGDDGE